MALQKIPGRAIQLDSQANSDIMYFNGTDWVRLEKGEADDVLTVNEIGTVPQWGTPPWRYPGLTYGYLMGGNDALPPGTYNWPIDDIEKYSMTSDTNSISVANLTVARNYPSEGNVSQTHGYCCGGHIYLEAPPGNFTTHFHFNIVEKFQYSNDADATDVGDMTIAGSSMANSASGTHGYNAGGVPHGATYPNSGDVIEKFAFATDANSTNVADMFYAVSGGSGHSSVTHGYAIGGSTNGAASNITNVIQKWSMVTDVDGTDVANLIVPRMGRTGSSSLTHGYKPGGVNTPSAPTDEIEKFTFASDSNATSVGNLTANQHGTGGGASSEDNGYVASGMWINIIEKYSHVTDGNSADIADVSSPRQESAGNHV